MAIRIFVGGFLLVCMVGVSHAVVDEDLISFLPGLAQQPKFKQYSGYLPTQDTRMLHYWFVESQNNPSQDPVVLWMNGGPGCSSLDGFLSEHGPFLAVGKGKTTLRVNPYSWNLVANMLYLEAPAGVGYSYAGNGHTTTNDDQTSKDNYLAIKYFLKHYPEFSKNDFFITGESYGGIYVPTLASRVVDDPDINLKGFAVGNGLSDDVMNTDSLVYFAYYHGLYDTGAWDVVIDSCCKNGNSSNCQFSKNESPACQNALNKALESLSNLNIYNLYGDCYKGPSLLNDTRLTRPPMDSVLFSQLPSVQKQMEKLKGLSSNEVREVPPCIDVTASTIYLNRADVRKALHIPSTLPKWEVCSGSLNYNRQYHTMRPQYLKMLATKKVNIMVYNGDCDMACNFLGDEWFVESLNLPVVFKRVQWMYNATDGSTQVGGYVKHYQNLALVTVKGAGHMVPQDKPIQALTIFKQFVKPDETEY